MKRPIIGVTTDYISGQPRYMLSYAYADAVERAGGLPLLIPFRTDLSLIPQIVDQLDGILFSGGDDPDSARWGEPLHPKVTLLNPERERFEFALLAEVEKRRLPTLGVCLGSQMMNIYRGGSLIQFLPEYERPGALEHRKLDLDERRHPVAIAEDSTLARLMGCTNCEANTQHKQAIGQVGTGLRVVATAPDGVIEGIEDPSLPLFVGVQWHPERLGTQPEQVRLFQALVERAAAK